MHTFSEFCCSDCSDCSGLHCVVLQVNTNIIDEAACSAETMEFQPQDRVKLQPRIPQSTLM
jgi:hypothetical protein